MWLSLRNQGSVLSFNLQWEQWKAFFIEMLLKKNRTLNVWAKIVPPADSDSDLSLSGFETVASHSFDEEDEEDSEDHFLFSVPYGSPTSMLQEDPPLVGDAAQPNGIAEHRSVPSLRQDKNGGVKPTSGPFCFLFYPYVDAFFTWLVWQTLFVALPPAGISTW